MNLGNRIKIEREKLNMSQDDLACKMNISRQAVSKWETGTSYPDIERIIKLSDLFNLSLDELVKGDKSFQNKLINESKNNITGFTITGMMFIALGIIVCFWGGSEFTINLQDINYMSFLTGGFVLITIGLILIRQISYKYLLGSIYLTSIISIIYLIDTNTPIYNILSGIVVILGLSCWLTLLIIRKRK